jgi:hypothetical protein
MAGKQRQPPWGGQRLVESETGDASLEEAPPVSEVSRPLLKTRS